MRVTGTDRGKGGTKVLRTSLDMVTIEGLRVEILDAMSGYDSIVLHVENPGDLCFNSFQLLCSACQSATKANKRFSIQTDDVKAFNWNAGCAGMLRNEKCPRTGRDCCFSNIGQGTSRG